MRFQHFVYLVGAQLDIVQQKKYHDILEKENIEVLLDDRDVSAGEKFNDADLIGIPYRLVVSDKAGSKLEIKNRNSNKKELLTLNEVIKRIKK